MATYYDVTIKISDGSMTESYTSSISGSASVARGINKTLEDNKDYILNTFPTNQWIYQWIISYNIDSSLESFFTAFGVTGNENLMNALLDGSSIVRLGAGNYVLSFEGY